MENAENPAAKRPKQYQELQAGFRVPTTPKHNGIAQSPSSVTTVKRENVRITPVPFPLATSARRSVDATPASQPPNPFLQSYINIGKGAMNLDDLHESIEEKSRTGVPDFIDQRVMEEYALQAIHPWDRPLNTLLDHTLQMVRAETISILRESLSDYLETALFKDSKPIVERFLDVLGLEQRAASMEFYEMERYKIFTINDQAFTLNKAKALGNLKTKRRMMLAKGYVERQVELGNMKVRDEAERDKRIKEVKDADLPDDPFEEELKVAAYIKGYYITAGQRFVDTVCADINARLFRKIQEGIDYLLETRHGLDSGNSEEKCQELLAEDAGMARRRSKLKQEKEKLSKYTMRLQKLARDAEEASSEYDETDARLRRVEELLTNGHGNDNGNYEATISEDNHPLVLEEEDNLVF